MALSFCNLEITPEAPVERWPTEAVLAALQRGSLADWRRLAESIERDPWGLVARRVEEALAVACPYGVAELMERAIDRGRRNAIATERAEVAALVAEYLDRSGLSRADFAERIGTSSSRLSTYLNGRVAPSSTLLVRMRHMAQLRDKPAVQDGEGS